MFQSLKLLVDQQIDLNQIKSELISLGYEQERKVFKEGEFSQRGGIIDIFPTNFDCPIRIDLDDDIIRFIRSINPKTGDSIWSHEIVIILANKKSKKRIFNSETPLSGFVDIKKGDYVVHNNHGIGKFIGFKEFSLQEKKKEHLIIEYKGGDRLFVPRHDIHLVQKYVGFSKHPPRLYKLGSGEWKRIKARIQKRIQRFAAELLRLQAIRSSLSGYAFSKDTPWQTQFEKKFPYKETPDQIKSTEDVKKDMEAPFPMDRLICGDVGYGKTEVAMRAAFKAVMDNRQVSILVPTTILAEQHFYNFRRRCQDFPVRVEMLSRFRTRQEQKEILEDLSQGQVDMIIGTHRLLSGDIKFKNLGLLVIDEEQRFGVRAKERIKHLKLLVDVLTLTATPIPRTLYMSLSGAKDMSVISTPPQDRIPVSTHIVEFDEDLLKESMQREFRRKGQVFFLHNRVDDIERIAKIIIRLCPGTRVAVAHGQMPNRLLEEIMLDFLRGKIDILVCTTIIESGIDIPNANTLIVNRADRFGLAELHQLRGRVGRYLNKAYAYFITPPRAHLSRVSKTRLDALQKHSGLGSGFDIAFEDLQIRGAGNLLGEQQHGYIASVGFDLYCRLLKESITHIIKKV